VFVEIWDDPLTTAGKGSFLSEIVALAGGRNVGDRVEKDFYVAAPEWVVAQNPDIILGFSGQPRSTALARMQDRPGWAGVNAVRTGRVYAGLNDDVLLRPGPRVLDGIEELRRCIEPAAKQAPEARAQP
jgi:iron complex transport system substrate-binding protein